MNLDELQSIRDRERQTDNLQQLRDSFYTEAGEYIQELRAERDRIGDQVDDPWNSPEASRLNDEIETATTLVQDIRDRRIGKLVKKASLDAAGLPAEVTGLSAEEQELFERLVDEMEVHRQHVMEIIEGGGADAKRAKAETTDAQEGEPREVPPQEPPPDLGSTADGDDADSSTAASDDPAEPSAQGEQSGGTSQTPSSQDQPDANGDDAGPDSTAAVEETPGPDSSPDAGGTRDEPDSAPPETDATDSPSELVDRPQVERQRVLVTEDVDTFVGSDDRDYDLSPNDVVMLPTPNATVLVERDAARRL